MAHPRRDTGADADTVLAEAEAIRRGDSLDRDRLPAASHSPERDAGGPAPGEAGGGSSPSASPSGGSEAVPSEEARQLGQLCVTLTDLVYLRFFGPAAAMGEPLRAEATAAWTAVIHRYLPIVQQAGPLGALAMIYAAHTYALWTHAQSASSAADEAAEKPHS